MAVMIADHLVAGEGADRCPDEDIAGPVPVVVHPGEGDHTRTAIHRRPDKPSLIRIPPAHLGGYRRRRRKCGYGMSRRKRSVAIVVPETAKQLPVVRVGVFGMHVRPLATEHSLQNTPEG